MRFATTISCGERGIFRLVDTYKCARLDRAIRYPRSMRYLVARSSRAMLAEGQKSRAEREILASQILQARARTARLRMRGCRGLAMFAKQTLILMIAAGILAGS